MTILFLRNNIIFTIKVVFHLVTIAGLVISLGELSGCIKDQDRRDFYQIIKDKKECSLDLPGAQKFMNSFVYNNKNYSTIDKSKIEKIIYTGLLQGPSGTNNLSVHEIIGGGIKLQNIEGKVTKELCSFEQLRVWSEEAPLWKWGGWIMVAVGVLLTIIIFIFEEAGKAKEIKGHVPFYPEKLT